MRQCEPIITLSGNAFIFLPLKYQVTIYAKNVESPSELGGFLLEKNVIGFLDYQCEQCCLEC